MAERPISRDRLLGSLKEAVSRPEADRSTLVALATALVTARADAEGSSYFQDLSQRNPADATAQALARFSQVRAGHDVAAVVTGLDKAATKGSQGRSSAEGERAHSASRLAYRGNR